MTTNMTPNITGAGCTGRYPLRLTGQPTSAAARLSSHSLGSIEHGYENHTHNSISAIALSVGMQARVTGGSFAAALLGTAHDVSQRQHGFSRSVQGKRQQRPDEQRQSSSD